MLDIQIEEPSGSAIKALALRMPRRKYSNVSYTNYGVHM